MLLLKAFQYIVQVKWYRKCIVQIDVLKIVETSYYKQ